MQHKPSIVPISADLKRWRHASITQDQITVKGGQNKNGEITQSIQYQVGDTIQTFVALNKEAMWFVKGVGGKHKGDLKPIRALKLIRDHFQKMEEDGDPDDTSAAAVAGVENSADADRGDVDPMDALDVFPAKQQCLKKRQITPQLFAKWMQGVLGDERSNAFSKFVHDESCRIFHGTAALQVPGI